MLLTTKLLTNHLCVCVFFNLVKMRESYQSGDGELVWYSLLRPFFIFWCEDLLGQDMGLIDWVNYKTRYHGVCAKSLSLNHYKTLNMDLCHLIRKRRDACRDANWIQFMLIVNMAEFIKRNDGFVVSVFAAFLIEWSDLCRNHPVFSWIFSSV